MIRSISVVPSDLPFSEISRTIGAKIATQPEKIGTSTVTVLPEATRTVFITSPLVEMNVRM